MGDWWKLKLAKTEYLANYLLRRARKRAKRDNLPFTISKDYVQILIDNTKNCPLLDIPINYEINRCHTKNSPSLDQIIPNLGYTPKNTWLISMHANTMKSDGRVGELTMLANNLWAEIRKRGLYGN